MTLLHHLFYFCNSKNLKIMFWKLMLIVLIIIAFCFAAIGIKMFLKKDGKFTKSCSSTNTSTGEKIGCTCSSQGNEGKCENFEKHNAKNS